MFSGSACERRLVFLVLYSSIGSSAVIVEGEADRAYASVRTGDMFVDIELCVYFFFIHVLLVYLRY